MGCNYAFYLMSFFSFAIDICFVLEFLWLCNVQKKREPTQSEIFVETRKGNKGKEMDAETEKKIVCQNLTLQ